MDGPATLCCMEGDMAKAKKEKVTVMSTSVLKRMKKDELISLLKDSRDHYAENSARWQRMVEDSKVRLHRAQERVKELEAGFPPLNNILRDVKRQNETFLKLIQILVEKLTEV